MTAKIKIKKRDERICQGDIFENVRFIESISIKDNKVDISLIEFPLVIVLSQDCDLASDFKLRQNGIRLKPVVNAEDKLKNPSGDQILLSVAVAPVYNVEHVYDGSYYENLGIKMAGQNKPKNDGRYYGSLLVKNEIPRFHFIDFSDVKDVSVVNSIIDFKHYFTVSVTYLYEIRSSNLVCSLEDLFREAISQRFTNYLARIGLPV